MFCAILTARDSPGVQHGDGAQPAVLRPVQLPVRTAGRRVRSVRRRRPPPPTQSPLLPLRPLQGPHRGRAPGLRGGPRPAEESPGGGGVQVRDEPGGEERRGRRCRCLRAAVTQNSLTSLQGGFGLMRAKGKLKFK